MKTNKNNTLYILFIIAMYIFVFQNLLQKYFVMFQYFDEIFVLLTIPVFIIYLSKNNFKINIYKNDKKITLFLGLIIFIGLIQNFRLNFQSPKYYLSDLLLFLKFFLGYFLSRLTLDKKFFDKYNKKIKNHVKLVTIILFLFTIANYIFKLYPAQVRYGIISNQLFYSHPTYLAAVCIFLFALYVISNDKKFDIINIILIFLVISTLRIKAIASAMGVIIIYSIIQRTNKKINLNKFAILAILLVIVGYSQFQYYFLSDGFARKELLFTSFKIAGDYFPLGTGFATYATYFSGVSYSPVYYKYGLSTIWGLGVGENFFSDSFWPAILGQFGYLGLLSYLLIILCLYRQIQSEYNSENNKIYIAKIVCLLYLLISSTSESAFFNTIAIPLSLIIGIMFNEEEIKNDGK